MNKTNDHDCSCLIRIFDLMFEFFCPMHQSSYSFPWFHPYILQFWIIVDQSHSVMTEEFVLFHSIILPFFPITNQHFLVINCDLSFWVTFIAVKFYFHTMKLIFHVYSVIPAICYLWLSDFWQKVRKFIKGILNPYTI